MKRKVKIPTKNDVLCGRSGFGGIKFRHEGNMHFRFLIEKNKEYYAYNASNQAKRNIASIVINHIRKLDPPGRFLTDDQRTGDWEEIPFAKAIVKTCQAFREHQSKIRKGLCRELKNQFGSFTEEEVVFILETFKR